MAAGLETHAGHEPGPLGRPSATARSPVPSVPCWPGSRAPESQVDDLLNFETSERFDDRERTALSWAMAIAWDPGLADDELWARLHEHFTEPQLIELGHFIALTLGQQRFLKTVGVRHGEVLADTNAGLAPEEATRLHAARRLEATP